MNKFTAIIILNPDLKQNEIDIIQSNIINLFEQKSKVQKVWFLGKKPLEYEIKKYSEGIYLKLEIVVKEKKLNQINKLLKMNKNVIFSIVIKNENSYNNSHLFRKKIHFKKDIPINNIQQSQDNKKVYLLINKNKKLPFCESDILTISDDIQKIFEYANKKIQEYIFYKGYYTNKKFISIKDVEKQLKRDWKVEFVLEHNHNVGQELLIQEKYLI